LGITGIKQRDKSVAEEGKGRVFTLKCLCDLQDRNGALKEHEQDCTKSRKEILEDMNLFFEE
jgi:hypothetical protein